MYCAPKSDWGVFGSLFFIGCVISSFIFPRLSDKYGRRNLTILGYTLHLIPSLIILVSESLHLSLAMSFFMGFAMGARVFVGYVWMTENMRLKDVPTCTALLFFIDSMGIFVASIYFKYIGKDWRIMFGFPALILACDIVTLRYKEDSPKFYYSIGQYDRARDVLTTIGRTNGVLSQE